jgi:hypothetical protein
LVERSELAQLPTSRKKRLTTLWSKTKQHYFHGTGPKQLSSVFAPYAKHIESAVQDSDCVTHALGMLAQAGLAIVNIQNAQLNHWVLAVGAGGHELDDTFEPQWLLILDPGHGPLSLTPWNGLLSIKRNRNHHYAYDTPNGRQRVAIECVVTVRRVNHVA